MTTSRCHQLPGCFSQTYFRITLYVVITAHTPFPYQTNATIYVATLSNFVLGESEKLG
jgi:hypothetical protein